MTMELSFVVPGPPVPCGRPRVVRRKRGAANVGKIVTFMPDKTRNYEQHFRLCAQAAVSRIRGSWPLDWAKYGVELKVFRNEERGDWDNYGKVASDALNGVLWRDDGRVVVGQVVMPEGLDGGPPRAEMRVWLIGEERLEEYLRRRARERARSRRSAGKEAAC